MDDTIVLGGLAATPIITALLQVAKPLLPARFLPFVAIVLGVGWQVALTLGTDEWSRSTVLLGVIVGLAASGLYSAGRVVVEAARNGAGANGGGGGE